MKGNSDVLVDPLKLRTYGVKKGLTEKEQKIKELYDQNRRYYPTNNKGKCFLSLLLLLCAVLIESPRSPTITGDIDEWAAVVKKQSEMIRR